MPQPALLAPNQTYFTPNAGATAVHTVGHVGTAAAADHAATTAIGTATSDYLSTTALQIAIAMLEDLNVPTFRNGNYVLLASPTGTQQLKNERDTGGFRYVTARNEGVAGNSIYRGQIGETEGADIMSATRMPNNVALLIGADALAKVHARSDGYSASPQAIVAPVVDKLRSFLSWGWLHYVGYELFDVRSIVQIHFDNVWRPAGADNIGAPITAVTPAASTTRRVMSLSSATARASGSDPVYGMPSISHTAGTRASRERLMPVPSAKLNTRSGGWRRTASRKGRPLPSFVTVWPRPRRTAAIASTVAGESNSSCQSSGAPAGGGASAGVRNSPSRITPASRMAASMLSRMRLPIRPMFQASRSR